MKKYNKSNLRSVQSYLGIMASLMPVMPHGSHHLAKGIVKRDIFVIFKKASEIIRGGVRPCCLKI